MNVKRIALFASGSGTNAENIIKYFFDNEQVVIDSLWSNKADAFALKRAEKWNVETYVFTREQFYHSSKVLDILNNRNVDLIVLAGFLWLIPLNLIHQFTIINIHPALLPSFGGKGLYGMNVHKAVFESSAKVSGPTVHFVDETYDTGRIIAQKCVDISDVTKPEEIAARVLEAEHKLLPFVLSKFAEGKIKIVNNRVMIN